MIRVAVDVTQVDNQNIGSGQFRYALDLVSGLVADGRVHVTLLGSTRSPVAELAAAVEGSPARCEYIAFAPYKGTGYFYRDLARLTLWLAWAKPDVFHQLHTNIPVVRSCPVIVTAYHYFDDPVLFSTRPYRYYLWALRRRADLVVAISEATRRDVHECLLVPLERIQAVYPGLSPSLQASTEPSPRGRPYLLSPYNLSPPKNLASLIRAWPAIASEHPQLELVLYGRAHVTAEREHQFEEVLRTLPYADRIRRIGQVDDRTLGALYRGCALFVFPTTVEGFGYPLLEAMAEGACCITRNASAMKEVGGDAVRLVETLQPDDIASAANALLADASERQRFSDRARVRAATFTVGRMIDRTVAAYSAVASRWRGTSAER